MDFVIFSSGANPAVTATNPVPKPSTPEREMWQEFELSSQAFHAGVDHAAALVEERRRLEREADDFDIWNAADFVPEEDPNDPQFLLDELDQDDILTELLKNARM